MDDTNNNTGAMPAADTGVMGEETNQNPTQQPMTATEGENPEMPAEGETANQ